MGFLDDAKETVSEAAEQAGRKIDDTVDRAKDQFDEVKADAAVNRAEELNSTSDTTRCGWVAL